MIIHRINARIKRALSWRRRELSRLSRMGRGIGGETTLIEPAFRFPDGQSFACQYHQFFIEQSLMFRPRSNAPRVLDCGANAGVFTMWVTRSFPRARVLAFEPDPRICELLTGNVARCCGDSHVEIIQAALVASESASVPFDSDDADAGRLAERMGPGSLRVPARRLREYLKEDCDLLKVDIEGAEVDVIIDCEDYLSSVHNIFVEYHSFVARPQRLDELLRILRRAGFRVAIKSPVAPHQPFVESATFRDLDMGLQLEIFGTRESSGVP